MALSKSIGSLREFQEYELLEGPVGLGEVQMSYAAHPVQLFAVDCKQASEDAFRQYCQFIYKKHYYVYVVFIVNTHFNQSGISETWVPQFQVDAAFKDGCKKNKHIEHKFTRIMKEYDVNGKFQFISGSPGQSLVRCADKVNATAIITSTNDRGLVHRFLKPSVSRYVQKHANCNVMSIKDQEYRATKRSRTRTISDSSDASQGSCY